MVWDMFGKTTQVKNEEYVLIKHIIPTGLKLMIINPLFVDVCFPYIFVLLRNPIKRKDQVSPNKSKCMIGSNQTPPALREVNQDGYLFLPTHDHLDVTKNL